MSFEKLREELQEEPVVAAYWQRIILFVIGALAYGLNSLASMSPESFSLYASMHLGDLTAVGLNFEGFWAIQKGRLLFSFLLILYLIGVTFSFKQQWPHKVKRLIGIMILLLLLHALVLHFEFWSGYPNWLKPV